MANVNPDAPAKFDAYIEKCPDDRRPIMEELRKIVHSADSRIMEDWKWQAPCFNHEGLVCWIANFKGHVGINFFKGALIEDTFGLFEKTQQENDKGNRMIHFHSLDDINNKAIIAYVKEGIQLNEQGIKVEVKKKVMETPDYFQEALNQNTAALKVYQNFTDAQRRDYIEWLVEAKREATRDKRMAQAIEWIAEGKVRNWKYMNC